jgi:multidrug resistance efflux pump
MTRTLKTLANVCLGALLFTSAGCEDKESQEALKTCRNDLGAEQKTATSQRATIDNLKAQLAQAEAKVQELTKASESAKPGKGSKTVEEKGKTEEAKKAEPAKAEKKAAKK